MNGLRKQSSGHEGPQFWAMMLFLDLYGQSFAESRNYCKHIRKWVWLESQIYTGWLLWNLSVKLGASKLM